MKLQIALTGKKILDKGQVFVDIEEAPIHRNFKYPIIKNIKFENKDGFDAELKIVLRIKVGTIVKTIDCGTVGNPKTPKSTSLHMLCSSDLSILGLTFNLVNTNTNKIVASNKGLISPLKKSKSSHLSPLKINWRDIKPSIWKIDEMNGNDAYVNILFDISIDDKNNLKKDSLIRSLIISSVLKEMLLFMRENELFDDNASDITNWPGKINYFIKKMGVDLISNEDFKEFEDFIQFADDFIENFLRLNEKTLFYPSINKLNTEYFTQ
ncbi:MAG: hypothetical protein CMD58_01900 [Gammaproteobacteria bacterium]|nr:hypothetical protein [Gammaproteobacteria bacterium]